MNSLALSLLRSAAAAALRAVNRKRSALEQDDATIGGVKKRLRLGSIYDYRKLAVLGEGRDGVVFKAEHLRTGDMVAIKWVRAAADQRAFIREVGCLAACRSHRNIVEVRDVVEDASTRDMFIVMDFVGGRTLHLDLWMTHPDPEEKARLVMRDLVAAAGALHAAGVMHRNIKPDNVLVTYGGGLKLCDFVRSSQHFAGGSHNNAANENQFSLMAVLACNKRKSIFVGTHLAAPYDYRKLTVLGEGRDGVVFKAEHLRTGDMVAIKWVRAAADQRAFIREVGCLAACRGHRNIVVVRDVVEDASTGDMFIVTDFVGGRTLRLDLWMAHPDPEERARSVMRDLVAAAGALHAAGVMHRDIKPDNVLVANGGGLKLCDFGSATPVKPPGKPYEESRVGTLLYTSPEQLADSEFYDPAVDMWALGCIMAEILTGGPLFDDSSEERMLKEMADMRHRLESTGTCKLFDELPELSAAGREVLAGMLAFNPDERMTAAEALDHRWFTGKPERRS
uniref:[RNA-polymerase]-subunit kinase n=1 Tax=Oryza barthii TaxID=65489 RepID=A0A0D3HAP8_9ORYZ